MDINLLNQPAAETETDWLIAPVFENGEFPSDVSALDETLGGLLSRLREADDLTGKPTELLVLHNVPEIAASRLIVVGLGAASDLDRGRFEKALTTATRKAAERADSTVAVLLAGDHDAVGLSEQAETAVVSLVVGSAGQEIYRGEPSRHAFTAASIVSSINGDGLNTAVNRGQILGECMNITRELVNRCAGDIYPASFAEQAQRLAAEVGLECEILAKDELQSERMGSMLAVAQGSDQPPRLVVLKHNGGGDGPTLGLVGKGVTFDSGGLSLKPTEGMKTMKGDMAGAGTVLGAMVAIARLKLPVNVIGFMGLVENMVSGSSYKLGDVLHARNGMTIEVLNTDAEGRLVLADVLNYADDSGVDRLIDLATLTGSCVVALGEEITGVFTNDTSWQQAVLDAAETTGEKVWAMPMDDSFSEQLKSDVADLKNVGTRWGGSITAAKFLEEFVGGKPWVHLDIAGPAFANSNKPHQEGGGSGCMLRTVVEVAARFQ